MKRETVQRLFMQHYARMYRVARTLLYDEQECEDVVGDIFESLLSSSMELLPDGEESARAWTIITAAIAPKKVQDKT